MTATMYDERLREELGNRATGLEQQLIELVEKLARYERAGMSDEADFVRRRVAWLHADLARIAQRLPG